MKTLLYLVMIAIMPLALINCAGIGAGLQPPIITEEGCFLAPITYDERAYFIGRCPDKRTVIQWSADNSETYRAYRKDSDEVTYYVQQDDGSFRELGAKEPAPPEAPPSDFAENSVV